MPAPHARARAASGAAQRPASNAEARELTNYRLGERIAQEELATVYRATHLTLDRPVVVSILRRTDAVSASRFQLAGRLAARLSHPGILPVIDAGTDQRYGPYLVTPQTEAVPLGQMLAQGPLPIPHLVRMLTHLASALDHLHSQRVIHRDVRPANILVTPQGNAYLTQFSLAAAPDSVDVPALDGDDYLTPYTAPEQTYTDADQSGALDRYSLGAVLYRVLSGKEPPPPGTEVPSLVAVDGALAPVDRVIRRLMSPDPTQRYTDAAQAVSAVRQALRRQLEQSTEDMQEGTWEASAEWLENPLETVIGAQLNHDFLTRSRARADALHRTGAIRRHLDRWSRRGFLRRPGLGQVIEPEQIVSYNMYFYELRTCYETRTVPQLREQPHTGAQIVAGRTMELWSVPVPTVDEYVDSPPEPVLVPGSQRTVACAACKGVQFIHCPRCQGKGTIEQLRRIKDAAGSRTETYQENCPACHGYGRQSCETCQGSGQLLQEEHFIWSRRSMVHFNEDELGNLSRATLEGYTETVYEQRIDPHDPRWQQIAPLQELVEEAIKRGGPDARIIAADLQIKGVPVTEIDYQYRTRQRTIALLGFGDEVRGDVMIYDLERLALYAALAGLALLVLILAVQSLG